MFPVLFVCIAARVFLCIYLEKKQDYPSTSAPTALRMLLVPPMP
jgi:hypothetical protein